ISVLGGRNVRIESNFVGGSTAFQGCPSQLRRFAANGIFVAAMGGSAGLGNGSAYIYDNIIGCNTGAGIIVQGGQYVYIGEKPDGSAGPNYIGDAPFYAFPAPNSDGIRVLATGLFASPSSQIFIRNSIIGSNISAGVYISGSNNVYVQNNQIYSQG